MFKKCLAKFLVLRVENKRHQFPECFAPAKLFPTKLQLDQDHECFAKFGPVSQISFRWNRVIHCFVELFDPRGEEIKDNVTMNTFKFKIVSLANIKRSNNKEKLTTYFWH